jgi:hypothetical protein
MIAERGKISWFGGPDDSGVSSSEDTAFWETWDQVVADGAEDLFLEEQPEGTTGLARRLDSYGTYYIAMRWDYDVYDHAHLKSHVALVRNPENGMSVTCKPADWGPHVDTDRICDVSRLTLDTLQCSTDDIVEVIYPWPDFERKIDAIS